MMPGTIPHPVVEEPYRSSGSGSIPSEGTGSKLFHAKGDICFLDNPYEHVDVVTYFWWSGDADSSSVAPRLDADAPSGEEPHGPASTADQMALVVHTLGFTKRQLAELFGVSRQTIYDWLRGGNVSGENADRLARLARLLHGGHLRHPAPPVPPVHDPAPGRGRTQHPRPASRHPLGYESHSRSASPCKDPDDATAGTPGHGAIPGFPGPKRRKPHG